MERLGYFEYLVNFRKGRRKPFPFYKKQVRGNEY
jgi:hypothetical protein